MNLKYNILRNRKSRSVTAHKKLKLVNGLLVRCKNSFRRRRTLFSKEKKKPPTVSNGPSAAANSISELPSGGVEPVDNVEFKILLYTTAHNSLSQRLQCALLDSGFTISIFLANTKGRCAKSGATVELEDWIDQFKPNLIICPFLTTRVPASIYEKTLTWIVHPGIVGDKGPSSLDWALTDLCESVLELSDAKSNGSLPQVKAKIAKRRFWGVTILEANSKGLDEGPIWASRLFDLMSPALMSSDVSCDSSSNVQSILMGMPTKSRVYRKAIVPLAIEGILEALRNLIINRYPSLTSFIYRELPTPGSISVIPARTSFASALSTTEDGFLRRGTARPLMTQKDRAIDWSTDSALQILARLKVSDSQPGVLTSFPFLQCDNVTEEPMYYYAYDGYLEASCLLKESDIKTRLATLPPGSILATRREAVLIRTIDDDVAIWITHLRPSKLSRKLLNTDNQGKKGSDGVLPKLPAVMAFKSFSYGSWLKSGGDELEKDVEFEGRPLNTYTDCWYELEELAELQKVIYIYFEFYNGAMSTRQCHTLCGLFKEIDQKYPMVKLIVLMGGRDYFSNGIHLSVIEGMHDFRRAMLPSEGTDLGVNNAVEDELECAAMESWNNIRAIDDVVEWILGLDPISSASVEESQSVSKAAATVSTELNIPRRLVISLVRGNAAAGGAVLACTADVVIASSASIMLQPSYNAMGLYGSEYWTYILPRRLSGLDGALDLMNDRRSNPLTAYQALKIGLIDAVWHADGNESLEKTYIRDYLSALCQSPTDKPMLETQIARKYDRLLADHSCVPLRSFREDELRHMKRCFWPSLSGSVASTDLAVVSNNSDCRIDEDITRHSNSCDVSFDVDYHDARRRFVKKLKPTFTTSYLFSSRSSLNYAFVNSATVVPTVTVEPADFSEDPILTDDVGEKKIPLPSRMSRIKMPFKWMNLMRVRSRRNATRTGTFVGSSSLKENAHEIGKKSVAERAHVPESQKRSNAKLDDGPLSSYSLLTGSMISLYGRDLSTSRIANLSSFQLDIAMNEMTINVNQEKGDTLIKGRESTSFEPMNTQQPIPKVDVCPGGLEAQASSMTANDILFGCYYDHEKA